MTCTVILCLVLSPTHPPRIYREGVSQFSACSRMTICPNIPQVCHVNKIIFLPVTESPQSQIINIKDSAASGCLRQTSHWERSGRKCQQLDAAYFNSTLPSFQPGFHRYAILKHSESKDSKLTMLDICFSTKIMFDHMLITRTCDTTTVE